MKKNTVTQEQVINIFTSSKIEGKKWGDKTFVAHCVLPNGFIIVESSSCVDPETYDEMVGWEICRERILNKIWELEAYTLLKEVNEIGKSKDVSVSDTIH